MLKKTKHIQIEPLPQELWLFRNRDNGKWVMAFDDPPGGEVFMAAFSKDDAVANLKHQADTYNLDCEAVCVFIHPLAHRPIVRISSKDRLVEKQAKGA